MSDTLPTTFFDQTFHIPAPRLTEANLDDQKGNVCIITGGYADAGYELARILYRKNGTVYVAGKDWRKGEEAVNALKSETPSSRGRVEFLQLDLDDLGKIKKAVDGFMAKEKLLHVLIHNDNITVPLVGSKTKQGHEMQMGRNCLGHFFLTRSLLPLLKGTASVSPAGSVRIAWGTSLVVDLVSPKEGVEFDDNNAPKVHGDQNRNYGQSKAGNILLANEFARRHRADGIISVAWTPGNLKTKVQLHFGFVSDVLTNLVAYPPINGAYTALYAGYSTEITLWGSGSYIIPWGRSGTPSRDISAACKGGPDGEPSVAERLWTWCELVTEKYS